MIAHNTRFNPEELAASLATIVREAIREGKDLDGAYFKRLCEDVWIELVDQLTIEELDVVNNACLAPRVPRDLEQRLRREADAPTAARWAQIYPHLATQVDEGDYFIEKDGERYDLRKQSDCDQLQAVLDMELGVLKGKWEVIKAEADALLKSVEAGIF